MNTATLLMLLGGKAAYFNRLKTTVGADLFRYYTLGESVGTLTATDLSANNASATYSTGTVPVLGEAGWGDGKTSARFPSDAFANMYSAAFNANFNRSELTIGFAFKAPASFWEGGLTRYFYDIQIDSSNYILMTQLNASITFVYRGGGAQVTRPKADMAGTGWYHICMTASKANDRIRLYANGAQVGADAGTLPTAPAGAIGSTRCLIGSYQTSSAVGPILGNMQHFFIANREMTAAEIAKISQP